MSRVNGKIAFITGAGRGIGEAIAMRLSSDGFKIACADLDHDAVTRVAAAIEERGGRACALSMDVSSPRSTAAAIEECVEILGDFHVMVNNAAIAPVTPIESMDYETFRRTFDINVGGVLWGIQSSAAMFDRLGHGGKIINACSQAGQVGNPNMAIYSGSKFAVRGITQTAARELAHRNITVNGYCPGIVETKMFDAIADDVAAQRDAARERVISNLVRGVALGRTSQPAEVAACVSFLAGPDSDYMTGQSLIVDGGMVFN